MGLVVQRTAEVKMTILATPLAQFPVSVIDVITDVPRAAWSAIAAADPDLMVSQTPAWLNAVVASGRFRDATRLYELSDGRRFVVPMVQPRGAFGPLAMSGSYPHAWGCGGLVGPDLDVDAARAVLSDVFTSAGRVRLRPNPRHGALYEAAVPDGVVSSPRRAHVAPLPSDVATMWTDVLSGRTRQAIGKAEREGVTVERDSSGRHLPILHDLFRCSVDRWATRQHEPAWLAQFRAERRDPIDKWAAINRHLGDSFGLWLARLDGEPIGAVVVLYGTTAHYARSVMRKDLAGPTRANYLLLWRATVEAIERGCTELHMGESGSSEGIARFKEKFGAVAIDHQDYLMERIPIARVDAFARSAVKRALHFQD